LGGQVRQVTIAFFSVAADINAYAHIHVHRNTDLDLYAFEYRDRNSNCNTYSDSCTNLYCDAYPYAHPRPG